MTEQTLQLALPVLLPEVSSTRDDCIGRLQTELTETRGILQAHLEHVEGQGTLCLHYDPNLLTLEQVRRLAENAGAQLTQRYHHETLRIRNMDCADCGSAIEHLLRRRPGVLSVSVNPASERMRVEFDTTLITHTEIVRQVAALGFEIDEQAPQTFWSKHQPIILAVVSGFFLGAGLLAEHILGLPLLWERGFYLAAAMAGGYEAARHGLSAALRLHFDIDFLMVLAAVGAAVLGAWAEGAFLLFLFHLGHTLEHFAGDRARHAIEALGKVKPLSGRVRRAGIELDLDVEEILIGDRVIVRPGERFPVDGEVITGSSAVNQAPVTGESLPVEKAPGSAVFAGTINGDGVLDVQTTRLAADSTMSRVIQMVEEAQEQKSPTQRFADRFTRVFVPVTLAAVALLIFLPPLIGLLSWQESLRRGLTLLVAASPCALAIATPSAVLAGIAQSARNGVLIKGGAHLEKLGQLRALAFDKTGTLTNGVPELTDVIALDGSSPEMVLQLAAMVESQSQHPLAKALLRRAGPLPEGTAPAEEVQAISGMGIVAQVNSRPVRIGNRALFAGDPALTLEIDQQVSALEQQGKTTMLLQTDGRFVALFGLADQPRPAAAGIIRLLHQLGITSTVLLTGDNERTAHAVSEKLGLSQYRAGLLPEHKVDAIKSLLAEFGTVGMVGDGINDAPALATASIGIAMGGAGSDAALETADIALMGDDLTLLPFAVGLSRQANRIVRQNLVISLGTVAALLPFAVLGLTGIGPAIIFHEGSTIIVVLNALRLLSYRD